MLRLPKEFEEQAVASARLWPLLAPRDFVAKMRPGDPADPLLRQVLPCADEQAQAPGFTADPVDDAGAQLAPGLLQKYAHRALLITTGACAIHCRYCFRRHFPYSEAPKSPDAWDGALARLAADEAIDEVLLSGGDPLTLTDARLAHLADRLAAIGHLRRLRVHSRLPIVIPQRVCDAMLRWFAGGRLTPIMVVHANHPREIDDEVAGAVTRLIDAGAVVLNQAVLLRGVNDNAETLAELCRRLVDLRVMPYYLHQLDRVAGAAHFESPEAAGLAIIEQLRSMLPGYAVPRYARDAWRAKQSDLGLTGESLAPNDRSVVFRSTVTLRRPRRYNRAAPHPFFSLASQGSICAMLSPRIRFMPVGLCLVVCLAFTSVAPAPAAEGDAALVEKLETLSADALPANLRENASAMVRDDLRKRLRQANDRSREGWGAIKNRQQWEAFRDPRLKSLRESLGDFPAPPKDLHSRVTGQHSGDGFVVQNLLFESRPGLWVTANLYLPAKAAKDMPGILIFHSHHTPKTSGELQDMGMTWARAGCAVLVMDQIGYGERRQHPFNSASDYKGEFRVSRQDYYFRYDNGMQLHLVGDSLIGWMAWDMMRGVDLLLARGDVDPDRIVLLGSVAGGGDPAAVTGALDTRIACAAPFNFGGPQPETRYPLPDDVETSFNYAGSGSWESTRNLRRSAKDGFLPWVIVCGIAPRRLIFSHEFSWDRQRDPVWKRLETVYGFYDQRDHLDYTHGRGELRGRPPVASHCTHIGQPHRVRIHQALARWFGVPITPEDEYKNRLDSSDLLCLTPQAKAEIKPRQLHAILEELGAKRAAAARRQIAGKQPAEQRRVLREKWSQALGPVEPQSIATAQPGEEAPQTAGDATVEKITLTVEPGIQAPLVIVRPTKAKRAPAVVAVAEGGKQKFLKHRAKEIAKLVAAGVVVCLPDVRGVGETRADADRGQYSADTSRSSTELMLGGTTVGARLRDLRSTLQYLRGRREIDPQRIALWGDSFAPTNAADANFRMPRRIDGRPQTSEPLGGLLALLGALYDDDIKAVYSQGCVSGFDSALASPFVYLPHDTIVPGAIAAGDLKLVAATLAPRPLQLAGLVDGFNRRLPQADVQAEYQAAQQSYKQRGAAGKFTVSANETSPAAWLLEQLQP